MIAFGIAFSDRHKFDEVVMRGIRRAAEADSVVLTREGYDSIQQPYNEMIAEAAALPGVEALVLLHQDLELADGSLPARIRSALRDPAVGLVGALGWRSPDPHFWPGAGAGANRLCPIGIRLGAELGDDREHGSNYGQGFTEGVHEVELVDGVLMALAPWVLRSIRFDERLARRFHGYDGDFSLRVRAAGGRLICDSIPHVHHMSRPWRDRDEYVRASMDFVRLWDPDVRPIEWAAGFQL